MTKDELFDLHKSTTEKALVTMVKKNEDYAHGNDPFKNFKGSVVLGIAPEHGVLLRVGDKIQRLVSFIERGDLTIKDEPVDDAIEDIINYMVLLKGLIVEEREVPTVAKVVAEVKEEREAKSDYKTPIGVWLDKINARVLENAHKQYEKHNVDFDVTPQAEVLKKQVEVEITLENGETPMQALKRALPDTEIKLASK